MLSTATRLLAATCCALVASRAARAATCETFNNASSSLNYLCAGLIDYEFYLPAGYTQDDYNTLAISKVSSSALTLVPPACQADLKKLVCANVYKKCHDNVDLTNYLTYEFFVYNGAYHVLPYNRPCTSLCTATTAAGTTCGGLLEALGAGQNCSAVDPYTTYPQYSSASTCNALPAAENLTVASSAEPYGIPDGVCTDVVATVYAPPAPLLNETLAPMQPPLVAQVIIESVLAEKVAALPPYLSSACQTATRQLLCGVGFMKPQAASNTIVAGLLPTLHLPQYPALEICEEYNSVCAEFIAAAATKGLDLAQNCSGLIDSGLEQFPNATQTILTLPVPGVGYVPLTTEPNRMLDSNWTAPDAVCPAGFAAPENPERVSNLWVPGTGCAVACPAPLFTDDEYDYMNSFALALTLIGLPCAFLMVTTWTTFKQKRKQRIVLYIAILTAINDLVFFVQFMWKRTFNNRYCYDNTTPIHQEDGYSMCGFQAIMLGFVSFSVTCWWVCQILDIYLKAVLQKKGIDHYIWYYGIFSFGMPIVINTIPRLSLKIVGYELGAPYCFNEGGITDGEFYGTFYGVIGCLLAFGTFVMSLVISAIYKSAKSSKGSMASKLKLFRTPVVFVFVNYVVWANTFLLKMYSTAQTDTYREGFLDWIACIFANFVPGTDSDRAACGTSPEDRLPVSIVSVGIIALYSPAILVFLCFFCTEEIVRLWMERFGFAKGNGKVLAT